MNVLDTNSILPFCPVPSVEVFDACHYQYEMLVGDAESNHLIQNFLLQYEECAQWRRVLRCISPQSKITQQFVNSLRTCLHFTPMERIHSIYLRWKRSSA